MIAAGTTNTALLVLRARLEQLANARGPLAQLAEENRPHVADLADVLRDMAIIEVRRRLEELDASLEQTQREIRESPVTDLDRLVAKHLGIRPETFDLAARPVEITADGWLSWDRRRHYWARRVDLNSRQQEALRKRWGIGDRNHPPPDARELGLEALERIPDELWPVEVDAEGYLLANGERHAWAEAPMPEAEIVERVHREYMKRLEARA